MKHFSQFPLFQSHLDLAHLYWKKIVSEGDTVIDATCGNGYDTLVLAELALGKDRGMLIAIDKQPQAIEFTKTRLADAHIAKEKFQRIRFEGRCHSQFPEDLKEGSITLIVYNLGYLPGGDKTITTMYSSTIQSLKAALPLIRPGGIISITCYPGHSEGKREEDEVIQFSTTLDPRTWSCCQHKWENRQGSPSLLICQKSYFLGRLSNI